MPAAEQVHFALRPRVHIIEPWPSRASRFSTQRPPRRSRASATRSCPARPAFVPRSTSTPCWRGWTRERAVRRSRRSRLVARRTSRRSVGHARLLLGARARDRGVLQRLRRAGRRRDRRVGGDRLQHARSPRGSRRTGRTSGSSDERAVRRRRRRVGRRRRRRSPASSPIAAARSCCSSAARTARPPTSPAGRRRRITTSGGRSASLRSTGAPAASSRSSVPAASAARRR